MSTPGSPGGRLITSRPTPPERGSFPLDHDAECQPLMKQYLTCLRSNRGVNVDACRSLSRKYLECRMERNLMAPDSMQNLGFKDLAEREGSSEAAREEEKLKMMALASRQGSGDAAEITDLAAAKKREG